MVGNRQKVRTRHECNGSVRKASLGLETVAVCFYKRRWDTTVECGYDSIEIGQSFTLQANCTIAGFATVGISVCGMATVVSSDRRGWHGIGFGPVEFGRFKDADPLSVSVLQSPGPWHGHPGWPPHHTRTGFVRRGRRGICPRRMLVVAEAQVAVKVAVTVVRRRVTTAIAYVKAGCWGGGSGCGGSAVGDVVWRFWVRRTDLVHESGEVKKVTASELFHVAHSRHGKDVSSVPPAFRVTEASGTNLGNSRNNLYIDNKSL